MTLAKKKPGRYVVGVVITDECRGRIKEAAIKQSGKSFAQFVREAIDEKLATCEAEMNVG